MPRLSARLTFTEVFSITYTQPNLIGKAGFAIPFYVRVLTQATNCLCNNYCSRLVGYLHSKQTWLPLTVASLNTEAI